MSQKWLSLEACGEKWLRVELSGWTGGLAETVIPIKDQRGGKGGGNGVLQTGTYERTLDAKLRVMLPKQVKRFAKNESSEDLFVTPGTEGCLELHTLDSLDTIRDRVAQGNGSARSVRTFSRLFYAQAESCAMDNQSRIRLPKRLAEWAELEKEVVIVGVGSHFEIWDSGKWTEFCSSYQNNFDQIVETAMDASSLVGHEISGRQNSETKEGSARPVAPR